MAAACPQNSPINPLAEATAFEALVFANDDSCGGERGEVAAHDELVLGVEEQLALHVVRLINMLADRQHGLPSRDPVGVESRGDGGAVGDHDIKPSAASWQDTHTADSVVTRTHGSDKFSPPSDFTRPVLPGELSLSRNFPLTVEVDPHANTVLHPDFPRSQTVYSRVEGGLVGILDVTGQAGVIKRPDQVVLAFEAGDVGVVDVAEGLIDLGESVVIEK